MIDYYNRPEVSNSDLTALLQYFNPKFMPYDPEIAFKFGNLVDYMITEPAKVNYFTRIIEGYPDPFTPEVFKIAENMKSALRKDPFWKAICPLSSFQHVFTGPVVFDYAGQTFTLNMRCKYDFFLTANNWGGDLKTTTATTEKQFRDACNFFDYDRSRVLYMLLSKSKQDLIIGISKENQKIFKIFIKKDDPFWCSGYEKLRELAFNYFNLYENFAI